MAKNTGLVLLLLVSIGILFSCSNNNSNNSLLFTQVPLQAVDQPFPDNAKIAAINLAGENFQILTEDFQSARAPRVSFDGLKMAFSGKFGENDFWQIWEMDLTSKKSRQLTQSEFNCTDPAYLPDNRVVFSGEFNDQVSGKGFALFTIRFDGSDLMRITYQPHEDLFPIVMNDGRVLTASSQVYPEQGSQKLLAMRPDGTKAQLYYQPPGNVKNSRSIEMSKYLIFVERTNEGFGNLITISTNRPLNSRSVILTGDESLSFHSIASISDSELIASAYFAGSKLLSLSKFSLSEKRVTGILFSSNEFNAIEPVFIAPRPIPKKLPTRVNPLMETGKFVCLDANMTDWNANPKIQKIRVQGTQDMLGEVATEKDGSFYIEVPSNTPIRFEALDDRNQVLSGSSAWVWVRSGESHGCVGCHEDRELSPDNRVPDAIRKDPVKLPEVPLITKRVDK